MLLLFVGSLCKLVRKVSTVFCILVNDRPTKVFCILVNDRPATLKTCNRVKTSSLSFAIGKMNDRSIIAKTSQSKKLPSKKMKNYCNTWKNKRSSTKAQQVFLTSAHKLLSTEEDYQLRNFIFTIIHPGTLKSNKPRCITLRPSLLLALFSI